MARQLITKWMLGFGLVLLALGMASTHDYAQARRTLSLNGAWQFRLDPHAVGEQEGWAREPKGFTRRMPVPGFWQAQDIGKPKGYLRHDYEGGGWYRKTIEVPADWKGKTVWLRLGGASRLTKAFVNGALVGTHDGFSTPFRFDVTRQIRPGGVNTIVLYVTNDWPVGGPTKSAGRDTSKPTGFLVYQANWGGVYGHVEIVAAGDPSIDNVFVSPDLQRQAASVSMKISSRATKSVNYTVAVAVIDGKASPEKSVQARGVVTPGGASNLQVEVPIPNPHLWSPEDPFLYRLKVTLLADGKAIDETTLPFGMREISTSGSQLLLNGHPYFLRGYGDLDVEPITGAPPFSEAEYLRRIKRAKSYGFNYVRFHSRMPPPGFMKAADQEGLLISSELPAVYSDFFLPHVDFLRQELRRMVVETRNHPSVFLLSMGNEMDPERDFTAAERPKFLATLREFYGIAKQLNPKLEVVSSDGFDIPPSDLAIPMRGVVPGVANIAHEFGGYPCSLPDPRLISQFTGLMNPYWLKSAQTWVNKNGLADVYPSLIQDSQRLQWESRKFKIERLRATGKFDGYQLWAITDAPSGVEGGPWEEGVFDYFWDPKSIPASAYREFQATTVLLIDVPPGERTFWNDEGKEVGVSASYYGDQAIADATLHWKILADNEPHPVDEGTLAGIRLQPGGVNRVGAIHIAPKQTAQPVRLRLEMTLTAPAVSSTNAWDFWGYPKTLLSHSSERVVSLLRTPTVKQLYPFISTAWKKGDRPDALILPYLDTRSYEYVVNGGKAVIYMDQTHVDAPAPVNYFPDFVFWNPKAWGTRIEPHPLSSRFVQSGHLDMQFYDLMQSAYGFSEQWIADAESGRLHPIMWAVKTIPGGLEKAGFLYEFSVGKGKVILCSFHVEHEVDDAHPATLYFFDQVLRYALSDEFKPKDVLTPQQFSQLAFLAYR